MKVEMIGEWPDPPDVEPLPDGAEAIVRCRDCRYSMDTGKADVWCAMVRSMKRRDGYCDWGRGKIYR
jgi:hypothetical protein